MFLPQLNSAPLAPQEEKYADLLKQLEHALKAVDKPETRIDTYYVCDDHVGLKSRAGKRLEVKLRTSQLTSLPGAEVWSKYKLGMGDAETHLDDIRALLHNERVPHGNTTIDTSRRLVIEKTRYQSGMFFGAKEVTYLRPLHRESATTWVSLCIEHSSEASLMTSLQPILPLACQCLDMCLQLRFSSLPSIASDFFPVLSGYPAWIRCLSNLSYADSNWILIPIFNLFQYVHYTPTVKLPPLIASQCNHPVFQHDFSPREGAYDFSFYPVLCTRRLVLRRVLPSDADDIMCFRGDYEVTKYNQGAAYKSIAQVSELIASMDSDFASKSALRWGITISAEHAAQLDGNKSLRADQVIGMVGYNYWHRGDRRASVGVELRHDVWGKGYMQESLTAVLAFGFTEMSLNRIEASVSAHNERSLKMLKKLGFVQEGVQREQYYDDGEYHDLVLLALLKKEWSGLR